MKQWSDLSNGAEGVRADERVTTRDNEFCMRCSLDKFLDYTMLETLKKVKSFMGSLMRH